MQNYGRHFQSYQCENGLIERCGPSQDHRTIKCFPESPINQGTLQAAGGGAHDVHEEVLHPRQDLQSGCLSNYPKM